MYTKTKTDCTQLYLSNKHLFYDTHAMHYFLDKFKHIIQNFDTESQLYTNIVIDVGACIGKFTSYFNEILPNNQIICFEPNPLSYNHLYSKFKDNANISCFNSCISNVDGHLPFYNYLNETNKIGNGHCCLYGNGSKICDINTVTLKTFLDSYTINKPLKINVLKIDTEGHELQVLLGCEDYLKHTECIIFECSDCLDDHRNRNKRHTMREIMNLLTKYEFNVFRIGHSYMFKVNDEYWDETYENHKWCSDCFAIKKSNTALNGILQNDFTY